MKKKVRKIILAIIFGILLCETIIIALLLMCFAARRDEISEVHSDIVLQNEDTF